MKAFEFDHRLIDNSAREIVDTARRTGATVRGPVPAGWAADSLRTDSTATTGTEVVASRMLSGRPLNQSVRTRTGRGVIRTIAIGVVAPFGGPNE